MGITFTTAVVRVSTTATALPISADALLRLTPQRRPRVSVAVAGHQYRTRVTVIAGRLLLPLRAIDRAAAGITVGDQIEVRVELAVDPAGATTRRTGTHPIGTRDPRPAGARPTTPGRGTAASDATEPGTTIARVHRSDDSEPGAASPGAVSPGAGSPGAAAPAEWLLPITSTRAAPPGNQALVVAVSGDVDTITLGRFRVAVTDALAAARPAAGGAPLVLDLRAVTWLSPAGLATLLDATRAARPLHHGPVRVVVDPARPVLRFTDTIGHQELLRLYHRLDHALGAG